MITLEMVNVSVDGGSFSSGNAKLKLGSMLLSVDKALNVDRIWCQTAVNCSMDNLN